MTDLVGQTSKPGPPQSFGIGVSKHLNHYVAVADTKAAGVLTADLTLCGFFMTHLPETTWPLIWHWFAIALCTVSIFGALFTLFPRTPKVGSSLIFWEDICARTSLEAYLADLKLMDATEVERQYGAQNYFVSKVLSAKYSLVRFSMGALIAAIPFALFRMITG